MVSSAKGHDKLASGIAYCIRRSKHLGCAETTQCLWKALHTLAADQHSFSKPALCLVRIAASLLYWSGPSRSRSCHKDWDWNPNHWSCNHRIGMESPNRANCQNDCWHDGCSDNSSSKDTHGSSSRSSEAEPDVPPAGTALEAASSQVVVQPTAVERHETLCSDTMDPEPTSSPTQHARHSGSTLGESFFQLDRARQKEERQNARKAALLARAECASYPTWWVFHAPVLHVHSQWNFPFV